MTKTTNNRDDNAKYWIAVLLILVAMWVISAFWNRISAQTIVKDTIPCKREYIIKYIKDDNGKSPKFFAIYKDTKNDVQEIIPVNKTTMEYIFMCKQNGIEPSLGIYLKNGQIVSITKYRRKYYYEK